MGAFDSKLSNSWFMIYRVVALQMLDNNLAVGIYGSFLYDYPANAASCRHIIISKDQYRQFNLATILAGWQGAEIRCL